MQEKQWITKSDLLNFLECPFAFKKAKEEGFDFNELFISPFALELMKKGIEHEENIRESFSWEKIKFDITNEKCVMQDVIVSGPPIVNEKLGIIGNPDLIKTAKGKLIPIEIKLHSIENETDPYEIAFYWLLLEPYRKKGKIPEGYYILRQHFPLAEDISELFTPSSVDSTHIQEVLESLKEMRNLKDYKPIRNSSCRDCALFKKTCLDILKRNRCVSLLTAGQKTIEKLKEINFNVEKMAKLTPEEIYEQIRFYGIKGIGEKTIVKFHNRAKAFIANKPIIFGSGKLPDTEQLIFVDTEFYQKNSIFRIVGYERLFVISVGIYDKGRIETNIFYRNDCTKKFVKIMENFPNVPIITWSGTSADLSILKDEILPSFDEELTRKNFKKYLCLRKKVIQDIKGRHFDLLNFIKNNVSFPVVSDSLKTVAEFLGYERREKDMWGTDTFLINSELITIDEEIGGYKYYLDRKVRGIKNPEKIKKAKEEIKKLENERRPLMEKLIRYCEDDILSLIFVFEWLKIYL